MTTTGGEMNELMAFLNAYRALNHVSEPAQGRALKWLKERLEEDQRARDARGFVGVRAPTYWTFQHSKNEIGQYDSRAEGVGESLEPWSITEACGYQVVVQEFIVTVPIGDAEGNLDGVEHQSFPTRAEAEAYVKSARDQS